MLLGEAEDLLRGDVPRDGEDRVVGTVEGCEEALDVLERRRVEVVEVAVAVVRVLPPVEERLRQLAVLEEAVRVVLDVGTDLLLDDVALSRWSNDNRGS